MQALAGRPCWSVVPIPAVNRDTHSKQHCDSLKKEFEEDIGGWLSVYDLGQRTSHTRSPVQVVACGSIRGAERFKLRGEEEGAQ